MYGVFVRRVKKQLLKLSIHCLNNLSSLTFQEIPGAEFGDREQDKFVILPSNIYPIGNGNPNCATHINYTNKTRNSAFVRLLLIKVFSTLVLFLLENALQ